MLLVPYGPPGGGNMGDFVMHVNPMMQNRPPPNFQLSNCKLHTLASVTLSHVHIIIGQGRKRALLIGINYFGSPNELKGKPPVYVYIAFIDFSLLGCINDVRNLKEFLISMYHFRQVSLFI